ncbi:flagellar motor switch protein FliM [Palleronia aestuarii]|uniref:Flagellar motor switch protein FliM n=1 Tax=Palleronia aestuarii TaxID=568105 RepID=A0A2W7NNR9_9RHOB|nr:FliM/FliN family flagellar motor switch protein [Palleronia aestuarii]PZX19777.1 flagellar motor switch protein FliM [Palleronia aestuarii]
MSELSPLRRKIGAPRRAPKSPALDPRRVWRRALIHGFSRAIGLDAAVTGMEQASLTPDEIGAMVGEGALCALLDGPHGYGIAILDPGVVNSIVEMMTIGRVYSRATTPRAVTATDAAMMADPIDRFLESQEALAGDLETPITSGYRYATHLNEIRKIVLLMADAPHDHTQLDLSLGPSGERVGRIDVILPRLPAPEPEGEVVKDWSSQLSGRLMGSEVNLRAELQRLTLSVEKVQSLEVGTVLPLSRQSIDRVRLVTATGAVLSDGRLGQSAGRKAVRLGSPASAPFENVEIASAAPALE